MAHAAPHGLFSFRGGNLPGKAEHRMSTAPDPGYLVTVTLTPEESREARRRVRLFRFGGYTGLAILIVLLLFFSAYVAGGVYGIASGDVGALPLLLLGSAVLSVLVGSTLRGQTLRVRPFRPDATRLLICNAGICIDPETEPCLYTWDQFTALVITDRTYILMMRNSYLPVPKSALPPHLQRPFEIFTRGMCLKQGPSHDFPVLFTPPPPAFPAPPQTSRSTIEAPPYQKER
jgi:hypothetical protein